jgi:hypothetical protein
MSDFIEQVSAGRVAWRNIAKVTRFESWRAICIALSIGRQNALHLAQVNAPRRSRYVQTFSVWLDREGFSGMAFGLRAACCKVIDNLDAIAQWRALSA